MNSHVTTIYHLLKAHQHLTGSVQDWGGEGGAALYPFTRLLGFQDRGFLDVEPVLERLPHLIRLGNARQYRVSRSVIPGI